jgi:chromate reductase, NAD(P)H dehydrogenase (quinone)
MKKVLLFAGSNSPQSINRKLIEYTSTLFPTGNATVIDLREFPLPIFSTETLEKEGVPESALALKKIIDAYDTLVVSVAEHNYSVTSFFKNTLDWLSKTNTDYEILKDKSILLLSTSPSPGGGKSAATHAETILQGIGGKVIAKFPVVSFYDNIQFDKNGLQFTDEAMAGQLNEMAAKLIA